MVHICALRITHALFVVTVAAQFVAPALAQAEDYGGGFGGPPGSTGLACCQPEVTSDCGSKPICDSALPSAHSSVPVAVVACFAHAGELRVPVATNPQRGGQVGHCALRRPACKLRCSTIRFVVKKLQHLDQGCARQLWLTCSMQSPLSSDRMPDRSCDAPVCAYNHCQHGAS
jgi:hypothetical protein